MYSGTRKDCYTKVGKSKVGMSYVDNGVLAFELINGRQQKISRGIKTTCACRDLGYAQAF